jgi:O-antigen/teichoic acid export membrane protein
VDGPNQSVLRSRVLRRSGLAGAASGTFALKVLYAGLSFLAAVILARVLGAREYGAYAFSMAWVALLGTCAILGTDRLVVREIARLQPESAWSTIRGLLRRTNQLVAAASLSIAGIAAVVGAALLDPPLREPFIIAMLLVPVLSLSLLRQAAMQGLHRVARGMLPESLVRPGLLVLLAGIAALASLELDASEAVELTLISAAVSLGVGALLLRLYLPAQVRGARASYESRVWIRSALALTALSGVTVVDTQSGTVMLGILAGPEDAGVYAAAARLAEIVSFVLLAVNAPLAPHIARLYAADRMAELQRTVTRAAQAILLLTAPLVVVLLAFGDQLLRLFGGEFTSGEDALAILALGQLFNAVMGSVGILLIMTGHERDVLASVAVATLIGLGLTAALIPPMGVEGAAVGRVASLATWNVALTALTYRRLRIHATAAGDPGSLRSRAAAFLTRS